jgi:hypothetical protein
MRSGVTSAKLSPKNDMLATGEIIAEASITRKSTIAESPRGVQSNGDFQSLFRAIASPEKAVTIPQITMRRVLLESGFQREEGIEKNGIKNRNISVPT